MNKEILIKFIDDDVKIKDVDYIESIEQFKRLDDIDGIIIPLQIEDCDYNDKDMIDHIRTDEDQKFACLPISITIDGDVAEEKPMLNESILEEKYNNIGVKPRKTSGSRHDQANKWGVYRLLKFLNEFSGPNEEVVKYKKELSNFDLFYKKKINEELLTESKTAEIKIDVEKLVKEIKKSMKKVALVDDQANYGWDDAYSLIFGTNVVKSFSTANDFRDSKKKWDTYDLVLLDLRLEENENKRRSVLSGNELLVEIKNKIPEVPVIIVTASNKYNNLRDSLDSGANDYWVKESYELGVSKAYNIENSEKLLESIKKCLKWNKEIRPIIEVLNNIERNLRSIKKRKDFISNYLFISSFNDFIDAKLKSTTLEAIYLAAYSIINEIGSYYFKEKRIDVVDDVLDDEEDIYSEIKVIEFDNGVESEPFAYNKKEKDKNKWKTDYSEKIPDDVVNEKVTLDNNKTCYLIYKANPNSYKEPLNIFKTLRKKRNNLQLTHRNFNDPRANAVGLNDIKQLVNLLNETVATLG